MAMQIGGKGRKRADAAARRRETALGAIRARNQAETESQIAGRESESRAKRESSELAKRQLEFDRNKAVRERADKLARDKQAQKNLESSTKAASEKETTDRRRELFDRISEYGAAGATFDLGTIPGGGGSITTESGETVSINEQGKPRGFSDLSMQELEQVERQMAAQAGGLIAAGEIVQRTDPFVKGEGGGLARIEETGEPIRDPRSVTAAAEQEMLRKQTTTVPTPTARGTEPIVRTTPVTQGAGLGAPTVGAYGAKPVSTQPPGVQLPMSKAHGAIREKKRKRFVY